VAKAPLRRNLSDNEWVHIDSEQKEELKRVSVIKGTRVLEFSPDDLIGLVVEEKYTTRNGKTRMKQGVV